jgi:hypothetical protein
MEDGAIVRVIKDFLTINEEELCVTKGEFLQVRGKDEKSLFMKKSLYTPFLLDFFLKLFILKRGKKISHRIAFSEPMFVL